MCVPPENYAAKRTKQKMKPTAQVSGNEMQILCGILEKQHSTVRHPKQCPDHVVQKSHPKKKESNN